MNQQFYRFLAFLLCLLSLNVYAEYKTSGEMSKEEFQKVAESKIEYNECLDESAINQLEHQTDPRVVADHAMKECAHFLEDLYDYLLLGNYAPEHTKRFVSSISNRAANKLLSNLMMYMATQNQ